MSSDPEGVAALKIAAAARVDELAPPLVELSHRIHASPELGFAEHQAVAALTDVARAEGLEVTSPAYELETALSGDFGAESGPRVAVISEYDALPGIGHACGHNLIAAIGLGAALALHPLIDRLPGSVRYLGTPAEERGCGKELLARAGAFDDVDAAMMVHPASWNLRAVRSICLAEVEVTYAGRATHSALNPGSSRNALDAAVLSHSAIAQLWKGLGPMERVQGVIVEGGSIPSVVPERASALYYLRAANTEDLSLLKERVESCLLAAAQATGCDADLRWGDADYLGLRVNEPLAKAYEANAATLGREFTPYEGFPPAVADMGNVSHRVPVLHSVIACAPPTVMLHEPEFAKWAASEDGDTALLDGAKSLAMTAIDFLCDPELRERASQASASSEGATAADALVGSTS